MVRAAVSSQTAISVIFRSYKTPNIDNKYSVRQKKLAPISFCHDFYNDIYMYVDNFWQADTLIKWHQNDNRISHRSRQMFSPYLVKRSICQQGVCRGGGDGVSEHPTLN